MQARYYDPVIGRFLSNDPVSFTGSGLNPQMFNRYSYAFNDPVNMVDPDGQKAFAYAVRLVKGGLQRTKALIDRKQAIQARRRGENIQLNNGTRQQAVAVDRAAAKNPNDVVFHSGHKLKDGSGATGRSHAQTNGVRGHTFLSAASATLGAAIVALEVLEELDPLHIGSTACPAFECGTPEERAAAAESFSTPSGGNAAAGDAPDQGGDLSGLKATGVHRVSGRIESNNLSECGSTRCD
ncbi:MAG: RHS repeat-associated core domain-containing protein [Pseudomonadota bacterium]